MSDFWVPGAYRVDLSRWPNGQIRNGGGPFAPGTFMGLALHVNVAEAGTPDSFYADNFEGVCPTFQLQKSAAAGGLRQYLPLDWQPAAQVAGNARWAAIETAGLPGEPLTGYQMGVIEQLCILYYDKMGMVLQVTDSPDVPGLGTHGMGGAAWGNHPFCPGALRASQRAAIIAGARSVIVARGALPAQSPTKGRQMLLIQNARSKVGALILGPDAGVFVTDPGDYNALAAGGVPAAMVSEHLFTAIQQKVGGLS